MPARKPSVKEERLAVLIRTLMAAESNIQLAKKLITDIYGSKAALLVSSISKTAPITVDIKDLPGVEGKFIGKFVEGDDGKKYQIPENYASKSELVYGDRLKVVEKDGANWFKQLSKPDRTEVRGTLASGPDGLWKLLVGDVSYEVLPSAVAYHKGKEGSEAFGLVPADDPKVPFAALRGMVNEQAASEDGEKPTNKEEKVVEEVKEAPEKKEDKPEEKEKTVKKVVKKEEPKEVKKEEPAFTPTSLPSDDELR